MYNVYNIYNIYYIIYIYIRKKGKRKIQKETIYYKNSIIQNWKQQKNYLSPSALLQQQSNVAI